MKELKIGCGKPTGAKVGEKSETKMAMENKENRKEERKMSVRVGQKAPDFQAPAFQQGQFGQVSLSDYIGKWVVLCFYPGDFTFV